MLETIAKVIREYKDNDELVITENTTFEEIGLDSLDTVELAMNLEDELGIDIEVNDSIKTVRDLMEIISKANKEGN